METNSINYLRYTYYPDTNECIEEDIPEAEWIIASDGWYPYCSNCGKEPDDGSLHEYCPSCGANMIKSIKQHKEIISKMFNKSQD